MNIQIGDKVRHKEQDIEGVVIHVEGNKVSIEEDDGTILIYRNYDLITKAIMKYARKCSITGEGMNQGWCWGEGVFYTKSEKSTLAECRSDRDAILREVDGLTPLNVQDNERWDELVEAIERARNNEETDEDLLLIGYQGDYVYYTEWEDESEHQYEEINGKLIEIQ